MGRGLVRGLVVIVALAGCHSSSSGDRSDGGSAGATGGGSAGATGGGSAGATGGGRAGATGGGDPSTADGFCQGYLALVVDLLVSCDGVSMSGAQQIISDPITCERFDASLAAHRSSFDGTHAGACLDELKAAFACTLSGVTPPMAAQANDCAGPLGPLVPVGGECRSFSVLLPLECMGGSYCKENPNRACGGTCTLPAGLNEPCDLLSDARCATGLTCDSASKTCITAPPAGGMGASCGDNAPCAKGFYCETGADAGSTAMGTCQARKSSGACTTGSECAQPLQCAGPTGGKTCAAPKHPGAPCTPGRSECDFASYCAADGKCSGTYAAVGQPCGPQPGSDSVPCVLSAYCDGSGVQAGTCRALKQDGDACTGTTVFECGGNYGHCDATTHKCVSCPL